MLVYKLNLATSSLKANCLAKVMRFVRLYRGKWESLAPDFLLIMGICCVVSQPQYQDEPAEMKPKSELRLKLSLCSPVTTHDNVKLYYKLHKVIGTGHFGTVRLASSLDSPHHKVAVKVIDKNRLRGDSSLLRREIEIVTELSHPNIIRCYKIFEDSRYINIVTEYCAGGDLFSRICSIGHFSEHDSVFLMQNILRAISVLHAHDIVHRDIKPDNFLFANTQPESELKLIDFGLSNKYGDKFGQLSTIVGTPSYVAPEVLDGSYDNKCDVWSAGVIMFVMLSGNLPFLGANNVEVLTKVRMCKYDLKNEVWAEVSEDAKDLLIKLLSKEPKERPTAREALEHRWFTQTQAKVPLLKPEIVDAMRKYKAQTLFQKEALNVLVKFLDRKEIEDLSAAFTVMDRDNSGYITMDELRDALNNAGYTLAQQEIDDIMRNMEFRGDGRFEYSEFIAATIGSYFSLKEEEIWMCFRHFDTSHTGFITPESLDLALTKVGRKYTSEGITSILAEADTGRDGSVSYEEFREMLIASSQHCK